MGNHYDSCREAERDRDVMKESPYKPRFKPVESPRAPELGGHAAQQEQDESISLDVVLNKVGEAITRGDIVAHDFEHVDSGDRYLDELLSIANNDVDGLKRAQRSYGNSWKSRGGVGAFMMLARKWDRLENRLKVTINRSREGKTNVEAYDIFGHVYADPRSEGVIDDIRDLRRYLLLVEAELTARGFKAGHRDNQKGN